MPRKSNPKSVPPRKEKAVGSALVPVPAHARALVVQERSGVTPVVVRDEEVTLVVGQHYTTRDLTILAAEVYYDGEMRRKLPDGVWLGEADKVSWRDPATGYDCIMMRDRDEGFLSGYVGVPVLHPLHGFDHQALPAGLGIEVHGGLSYSRICEQGPSPQRRIRTEVRRICHVVTGHYDLRHATDYRAEDDHAWWFGFSCDGIFDVIPGRKAGGRYLEAETGTVYRDDGYVCTEVQNLAGQLRAIADGEPAPPRRGPPLPPVGLDPDRGR